MGFCRWMAATSTSLAAARRRRRLRLLRPSPATPSCLQAGCRHVQGHTRALGAAELALAHSALPDVHVGPGECRGRRRACRPCRLCAPPPSSRSPAAAPPPEPQPGHIYKNILYPWLVVMSTACLVTVLAVGALAGRGGHGRGRSAPGPTDTKGRCAAPSRPAIRCWTSCGASKQCLWESTCCEWLGGAAGPFKGVIQTLVWESYAASGGRGDGMCTDPATVCPPACIPPDPRPRLPPAARTARMQAEGLPADVLHCVPAAQPAAGPRIRPLDQDDDGIWGAGPCAGGHGARCAHCKE